MNICIVLLTLGVVHYHVLGEGDGELEADYLNEWAVEIPGGVDVAIRVASTHGYQLVKTLRSLDDYYLLRHTGVPTRSKRGADYHTGRLSDDIRVFWVEQQVSRDRVKRGYIRDTQYRRDPGNIRNIGVANPRRDTGYLRDLETIQNSRNAQNTREAARKRTEDMAYRSITFEDPMWQKQWYLRDMRTDLTKPKLDLHVIPAWSWNITGRGVVVSILDDGIERDHPDLVDNYDPYASYDVNDDDPDPMPRYEKTNENKHGTRCAGEVAMKAGNSMCGVGVAYNAFIGGVRMLDGRVTDSLEADALAFNHTHIDVYSASWGPTDDGKTVEGPGKLAKLAFEKGIREGRAGKGVIYVWASGNGGSYGDNCNCDGYAASRYTLSISSASEQCAAPWYGEKCASTMATAYSSGAFDDDKIISTDLHHVCTDSHTGTSAAAPLAAGIVALALEANPTLTWRDVQHLVAWTSEASPLQHNDNEGWKVNGAGYFVNTKFGFGLLNAARMVETASTWQNVPANTTCEISAGEGSNLPQNLVSGQEVAIEISTSGCEGQDNHVAHLEHVEVILTMEYSKRGDLSINLTSPSGMPTVILARRPQDKSKKGFKSWSFMSVHNWGETPRGVWKLVIKDETDQPNHGKVVDVRLVLHGTPTIPHHLEEAGGRRPYDDSYNNVQDDKRGDRDSFTNNDDEGDEIEEYAHVVVEPVHNEAVDNMRESINNLKEYYKNIHEQQKLSQVAHDRRRHDYDYYPEWLK